MATYTGKSTAITFTDANGLEHTLGPSPADIVVGVDHGAPDGNACTLAEFIDGTLVADYSITIEAAAFAHTVRRWRRAMGLLSRHVRTARQRNQARRRRRGWR